MTEHGMMGQDGMTGMMNKMRPMSEMMDHCNNMMQGSGRDDNRPNDQWRKKAPSEPKKDG